MARELWEEKRRRVSTIVRARKYSVTLLIGSLGVGFFITELQRIRELPPSIVNYTYLALLGLVGLLVIAWIVVTEDELELLLKWVETKKYDPPAGFKETVEILGLAMVLICLFFTARNPLYFALVFTVYSIAVLFAVKHMNDDELTDAFTDSKEYFAKLREQTPDSSQIDLRIEGISILEQYFIGRHHTTRHVMIIGSSILGLFFAAVWMYTGQERWALTSYVIFFLTILVSEIVIFYWRNIRDVHLRDVRRKFRSKDLAPPF